MPAVVDPPNRPTPFSVDVRPERDAVRVVVAAHRFAEKAERRFSLIWGAPAVQRALEVCGLLGVLHVDAH